MGFFDWIWAMVIFFFWIMALMVYINCILDVFRRDDLGGGMKAVWILVMFILPLIGCLAYLVTRPKVTMTDVRSLAAAEAASKAVAGVSTADELTKLAQLRDVGAITVPEYDKLKTKLLA